MDLPECGCELVWGEGSVGPARKAGGVGGGWPLLDSLKPVSHGAARGPSDGRDKEDNRLGTVLDSLGGGDGDPQAAWSRDDILPPDGEQAAQPQRAGERLDCRIKGEVGDREGHSGDDTVVAQAAAVSVEDPHEVWRDREGGAGHEVRVFVLVFLITVTWIRGKRRRVRGGATCTLW